MSDMEEEEAKSHPWHTRGLGPLWLPLGTRLKEDDGVGEDVDSRLGHRDLTGQD